MAQTKFGMQQTLDGETMATLDPIDEAVSQLKTEQQAQAERQQREQERANVAGQPGQQTLKSVLVIKNPVSPEAKRHKLEYDKQYESNPQRVKYREDLNRERRKRGIYGQGGPDMSHTKDHTLVAESPHTNRARHFKNRGTLK
jgi:hypothetical protein